MAQRESNQAERVLPEMAEMGRKRVEAFVDAQREFFLSLQETNRRWFDRAQSEAKITSDFANKVMSARSIPDALMACEEWTKRRLEMTAEDTKQFCADSQKFAEVSSRLMSSGFSESERGG